MAWLHTWAGLVLGWLLFFVFLHGTISYFATEIDRWMMPELPMAHALSNTQAAAVADRYLRHAAPADERWTIALPVDRSIPHVRVTVYSEGRREYKLLDPATSAPMPARATDGGQFLYDMHVQLHYVPETIGMWLVGLAASFMLVAIVTGVIVHRKIFADYFTFRPGKGQRSWLDAHNILGVLALPFHLLITYSGLLLFGATLMPLVIAAHYGTGDTNQRRYFDDVTPPSRALDVGRAGVPAPLMPLAALVARAEARWGVGRVQHNLRVVHPNDARARVLFRERRTVGPLSDGGETLILDGVDGTVIEALPRTRSVPTLVQDVLFGLHYGHFAGPLVRWIYFLWGLIGTAMIATGLALWTVKRREKLERGARAPYMGLVLVERLNVGTIIGLPVGIAAYFWANRLIPVEVAGRADWEKHTLFIVWTALLLHAALRPAARAWVEQCRVAAAIFALLPVVNVLTTDRHLAVSLPQGDWVMAGFDLTMLAFGAAFAGMARALSRRGRSVTAAGREPPARARVGVPYPPEAGA